MRKKFVIAISVFFLIILSYLTYNQLNPKYIEAQASIDYFNNFSELEETSELIVEATSTGKTRTVLDKDQYNVPSFGYSITKVNISKIHKAPAGFSAKTLNVVEPYWEYTSVIGEKCVIYLGDYRPMKGNKTYLLFLNKYKDEGYQVNNSAQGKYLLSEKLFNLESIDEFTPEDFEMGHIIDNYKDFYKEAKTNTNNLHPIKIKSHDNFPCQEMLSWLKKYSCCGLILRQIHQKICTGFQRALFIRLAV